MNQGSVIETFCLKYKEHIEKSIFFSYTCAERNKNVSCIVYCALCNPATHKGHSDGKKDKINSPAFRNKFNHFKDHLIQNDSELRAKEDEFGILVVEANIEEKINALFEDKKFRKWISKTSFWKFENQREIDDLHESLKSNVFQKSVSDAKKEITESKERIIQWGNYEDIDSGFLEMYEEAKRENEKFEKQKQIIDLLIESFSSFNPASKNKAFEEIEKSLEKNPEEEALLFAQLYLLDLHKENYESVWKPILEKLGRLNCKKDSPIYLFFESHRYWIKLKLEDSPLKNKSNEIFFVDNESEAFYQLSEPEGYINLFSTAIFDNPNKILLASRGLGYIAIGKFKEAISDFQKASEIEESESFLMNEIFASEKSVKNYDMANKIMNKIRQKSKNYVINSIKLFKKKKLTEEIVHCCKMLRDQGNDNTFVLIELSNALLKLNQIEEAKEVFSQAKRNNNLSEEIIDRFEKKKNYAEARYSKELKKHEDSEDLCIKLLQRKKTPERYYSLASAYYNQEKWDEAYKEILKAIELKNCSKYNKLLFYVLLMKKELGDAKKIMTNLNAEEVPERIREMINQLT